MQRQYILQSVNLNSRPGKKLYERWLLIVLCFFTNGQIFAQKVTVSDNINIRTNLGYDILPNIGSKILFYHDRGSEHNFEVYDENLKFKHSRSLRFPFKTSNVINMVPSPTGLRIFFQAREEQKHHLAFLDVNENADVLDSVKILFTKEAVSMPGVRSVVSEDKKKILFFWIDNRSFQYVVASNQDSCYTWGSGKVESGEFNFKSDFLGIELSNDGQIFILGSKERGWNRGANESIMVMSIAENQYELRFVVVKDLEITQIEFAYDNVNRHLCIAGLLSRNGEDASVGYFVQRLTGREEDPVLSIGPILFSVEFISEFYGKKTNKIKKISDLFLEDIILRADGGALLIMEIRKEFLRRAGSNAMSRFGDVYSGRGFIDYYNEDVLIVSNQPDGSEHWKNVLYKKQFSQDDNAMYSSYGLLLTPTRLRIIYNDEIKTNNTVSEYIIDPFGNFERNSVLSTQYQNLKLRFRDAVAISASAILIPSEQTNSLNLVKIDFSTGP